MRLSAKAIILGFLVDFLGSLFIGGLAFGIYAFSLASRGVPSTAIMSLSTSPSFLVFSLVVGLAMDVVGGYVAASLAKENRVLNAACAGVLSLIVGLLMGFGTTPLWLTIASILLVIPCAALGGWLRDQKHDSPPTESSGPVPPIAEPFGDNSSKF